VRLLIFIILAYSCPICKNYNVCVCVCHCPQRPLSHTRFSCTLHISVLSVYGAAFFMLEYILLFFFFFSAEEINDNI